VLDLLGRSHKLLQQLLRMVNPDAADIDSEHPEHYAQNNQRDGKDRQRITEEAFSERRGGHQFSEIFLHAETSFLPASGPNQNSAVIVIIL
jgi:hypothetical protein